MIRIYTFLFTPVCHLTTFAAEERKAGLNGTDASAEGLSECASWLGCHHCRSSITIAIICGCYRCSICIIGDTAQKTKERNDFSVFEHWGLGNDGYLYLIN